MSEKVTVATKVPPDVDQRVNALAERLGWTKSELVAHCLAFGLREGEKFADRIEGDFLGPILRFVFTVDEDDPEARRAFDDMYKRVRSRRKRATDLLGAEKDKHEGEAPA